MFRKSLGPLLLLPALTLSVVSPGAGAVTSDPPPTLDGQYIFYPAGDGGELSDSGFTLDCDVAGVSALAYDSGARAPGQAVQYLPDVGYFDPNPNPFVREIPYVGPVDLSVSATLGAHSLQPLGLDFTTGWYNEQQGTRGLPSAPLESLSGTFRVVDGDVSVEGTILLPDGNSGAGSCYDDLAGRQLDFGSVLSSGRQLRIRALDLAYEATITTSNGTFRDEGTLVMSLREEFGVFGSGISGGGVEARFSSNLDAVQTVGDVTPPTITIDTPVDGSVYTVGQAVTASYSCSDGGSGVASCVGAVPSGSALPTGSVGNQSFTVQAADQAGNQISQTVTYSVRYPFEGFLQPVDNAPTVNRVKAGQAIPIKFRLGGDRGLNIFASGSPTSVAVSCTSGAILDDIEQTVTAGASSLTYAPATQVYNYVWKTEKSWAGTCRRLQVTLVDGTTHTAEFRFT